MAWSSLFFRSLLVITDSQSLLAALNTGPLRQMPLIESDIWHLLLSLALKHWSIPLQFVYAYCEVVPNETVDSYATETMENRRYTATTVAPLWLPDLGAFVTWYHMTSWRKSCNRDIHRFALCGFTQVDLSGLDLLSETPLAREQLVDLSRLRCCEHPPFGRLFWSGLRDCPKQCRWCNLTDRLTYYGSLQRHQTDLKHVPNAPKCCPATRPATRYWY